jgi:transcriptional regulator with XRE-family HTH domain
MSESKQEQPFKTLGSQLKRLREKRKESLVEVSGAVEIDPEVLHAFEEGSARPQEDILLLLISHFATKEDVATKLWELAGYDRDELPTQNGSNAPQEELQQGILQAGQEVPIVYTDMVHIMVNNYGVIMNFMQTAGANNQPMAVARVGMSKEHAQSVLEVLQKTLSMHEGGNPETSEKIKDNE